MTKMVSQICQTFCQNKSYMKRSISVIFSYELGLIEFCALE